MAKIVLEIVPKNKNATQSVRVLNAELETLSKTLSTIKVNKNLTAQINALTKHYTALAKAAVRVNEATTKRQIAEQRLVNEVKRGRTEDQRTLKVQAQKETAQLRLKQAQDKATQSTQKQTTATKQNTAVNKEHRQSILSMTRGIFEWQIATTLVMKPLRALQDALASINETLVKTEDSVIALQRVLPSGSATDGEISSRLYKIAQDYGQTFDNVSQIAENFARTGMSWADTIKATEAAVLALNVAELDATEASEGLISIITQFDMSTAQLTETVDKLNKAADNNPVTTEKLLKALQRTGAAAKNANINLDDTIGIITTLSKATNRSGENLGTAVNSLIQFSSKASSLKVFKELGGDVATAVEKYQAGAGSILDIWEKLGAVIKDRQGNAESILGGGLFSDEDWAGLNEELKEALGESYADVTDIYDTASTFRKNYFIALLNDMENVKKVSSEIANAQGYSQDENQKYLDTYTAKLNSLQAKWQDIANDEQGWLSFKKGLVDLGNFTLTVVDAMGGLEAVVVAIGLALNKMFAGQVYTSLLKFSDGIGGLGAKFKSLLANVKSKDAWKNLFSAPKKSLQDLTTATENYRKAQQLQKTATEAQVKATNLQVIADEKAAIATELKTVQEANEVGISGMATAADAAQTAAIQAQTMATEAQTIASQKAAVAESALSAASKEMGAAASSAAGIWGILAFALYEVINLIDKGIAEGTKDTTQEQLETARETVNSFEEVTNSYNNQITAIKDYSNKIKNLDSILKDSNSSTLQVEYANNELLNIQNELIKSNEEYANSIDLVNGKLDEQSEIVRSKSEEEAKTLAEEYLERNAGAVAAAETLINGSNQKIELGSGAIGKSYGTIKILSEAIDNLGLSNAEAEIWRQGGTVWELPVGGGLINEAMEAADGQHTFSVWNSLTRSFTDMFTAEGWTGKSIARLNLTGSTAEQISALENLRKYINDNRNKFNEDDVRKVLTEIEGAYSQLNSEEYKKALKTVEANDMYRRFVGKDLKEGETAISYDQFKNWLSGDPEWATTWVNSLEHISDTVRDDLVTAMEEARDVQKEALELSEKQLAVEEARKALEDARNQATVRRFNQATGQWEWQVDEKKVAEAQERLNEAQKNLSEYAEEKAWDETKDAIEKGNATNKSILDILAKWAEASMQDNPEFVDDIKGIIKSESGTDVDEKGFKVNADGTQEAETDKNKEDKQSTAFLKAQEYIDKNGLKEADRATWSKDKGFAELLSNLTADEFTKLKGTYDNGGVANGLGVMVKATNRPESVNNPELTRKILSPVSNAEFNRYVRDMGIMFERSHQYAQAPIIERVGGAVDNRVNNSGQVIMNGVAIGSDKRGNSLDEILSLANIVPNV